MRRTGLGHGAVAGPLVGAAPTCNVPGSAAPRLSTVSRHGRRRWSESLARAAASVARDAGAAGPRSIHASASVRPHPGALLGRHSFTAACTCTVAPGSGALPGCLLQLSYATTGRSGPSEKEHISYADNSSRMPEDA